MKPKPMLATVYDNGTSENLRFPVLTQPKLDGVRMLTNFARGNQLILTSRNGKPLAVEDGLREALGRLRADHGVGVLDGELYVPGVSFQTLLSMVKKRDPRVQYHLFDMYSEKHSDVPFSRRFEELRKIVRYLRSDRIVIVPCTPCNGTACIEKQLKQSIRDGYEGLMIRSPESPYEPGKRSKSLLKYKKFRDAEFPIIGYEEGRGKDVGTIIFVCSATDDKDEMKNGRKTFRVRPKGTLAQRRTMFKAADSLVGSRLTVRFQELTDDGIPRFPVGIAVRDYE